ncbi:mechanosensitive ion channel protein MscS [Mycobacterium sp. MS1601]|uniref:mechanosensitive ion channel family protein n=1 Tax=Mycobacterium sp. MS1601 TaxID=1936029 RepID=UPI0009790C13|nr:mechanosensitive ion channel family protein [Mycobacterium sp. MS1601]AQA03380.1 mechanosensitive ion channel protein MscS [Mycobacterium sp. MS1601]
MPEEIELDSATSLAVTLAWVAGAIAVAYLLGLLVPFLLRRLGRRSASILDVALLTRTPFRFLLMVMAANVAIRRFADPGASWRAWVDHTLVILLIVAVTWLVASLVKVVERRVIAKFGGGDEEMTDADRQRRRVRTQVTTVRRLVIAIVVLFGLAAALMTFPAFANIGTTLFASAGVLSVVAGLAAQTSLGSVFAGMQIAFSDAIRVGDVVVLEDEWGRIEEITLTYVVVKLWDQRRLVLPTTYFTTTPFQNWTRNATELLGTVEFDVDFTVPLDAMRVELQRRLEQSDLWDGRKGVVQVTDAVGGVVRVRMLVSAPDATSLFDLRCFVREGLVEWLQRHHRGALPHQRLEDMVSAPPQEVRSSNGNQNGNGQRKAAAGLFSGSREAEERAREFDSTVAVDERDDDHRVPRGDDG